MQFGVNHQPEQALGYSFELKREGKKYLAEVLRTLVFFTQPDTNKTFRINQQLTNFWTQLDVD